MPFVMFNALIIMVSIILYVLYYKIYGEGPEGIITDVIVGFVMVSLFVINYVINKARKKRTGGRHE